MPRKLRLEFSGACYHVFNRGNYRRDLFTTDGAARSFYGCLDEACTSYGWRAHAFSIMGTHFHLAIETPEPNLSAGMQWLQGTWAQRFNRFRGEVGRPFQGRYKAFHVEPGHALAQVAHYIHLNPVQAGIVEAARVSDFPWSSLAWFPRRNRPKWLKPSTVLRESGGLADSTAGWRSYRQYLALLVEKDPRFRDDKFAALTRTWVIGSAAFRAEIRARLNQLPDRATRFSLLGADREAVRLARAELWEDQLRALATAFGITLDNLPRKKSATEKLILATALKQTTSVSREWLAQRLQMVAESSITASV
jgi:putative transposase